MANTVKLKRSAVANKVPTTSDLDLGELAINTYDGKLFLKKDNGTASIVEIGAGGSGSGDVVGPASATDNAVVRYDGTTGKLIQNSAVTVEDSGALRLNGSSSGYVALAPAAAAGSTTYTLPSADGTNGQVLSTDGSGTLSWATASGGGGGGTDLAVVRKVASLRL